MNTNERYNGGFVKTAIAVCSGTSVFFELRNIAFYRALLHFLLFAFIASGSYIVLKTPPLINIVSEYCSSLYKHFGGIKFTDKGIVPLKNEHLSRHIKIGKTKIDYIPDKEYEFGISDAGADKGFIWLPDSIYYWTKTPNGYQYFPLSSFLNPAMSAEQKVKNASSLERVLLSAKNHSMDLSSFSDKPAIDFSEIKILVLLITIAMHFFAVFINIIFPIPLYSIIMLAIFSIFGSAVLSKLKPLNFIAITLYASFPGLIIASLYSGLSLPGLDFKTVSFICFSVYTIIILNSLQKKFFPQKEEEDYDDDIF